MIFVAWGLTGTTDKRKPIPKGGTFNSAGRRLNQTKSFKRKKNKTDENKMILNIARLKGESSSEKYPVRINFIFEIAVRIDRFRKGPHVMD